MHFWVYLVLAMVAECALLSHLSSDDEEKPAEDQMSETLMLFVLAVIFLIADLTAIIVWCIFNW